MNKLQCNQNVYYEESKKWGCTFYSDRKPWPAGMLTFLSILMFATGAFFFLQDPEFGWMLTLFFAPIGGILLLVKKALLKAHNAFLKEVEKQIKADKEEKQKKLEAFKKEHPFFEDEKFYEMACKAGIPNVNNRANISRLTLFAENQGIAKTQEQLIASFNTGKNEIEKREQAKKIAELKEKENKEEAACKKYSALEGRAKSEKIIDDQMASCSRLINNCRKEIESIMSEKAGNVVRGTKKESSWATQGGIAAGIAGGAAGLAVAMDTMRNNQAVREHNDLLFSLNMQLAALESADYYKEKRRLEGELMNWAKERQKNKLRLVEKLDPEKLLKGLCPEVIEYKNSPTGAVALSIQLQPDPQLKVCDTVRANADGSIAISILADGEEVGVAICDLPYQGISRKRTLMCICTNITKQAEKYTFQFKPVNLWATENN